MRLLDFIFPRRCPVCDEVVPFSGSIICSECRKKLVYITEPKCKKCGKPIRSEREEFCEECKHRIHYFDAGFSVFVYNDAMKRSIYRFKYGNRKEYRFFYSEEILRALGDELKKRKPDALIPVPLHKARLRRRGYNQSELLAREIGRRLDIPVCTDLLIRTKETRPQKELNHAQRENNLKNAFKIVSDDVKLSTVVLVDDIFTTGSTIDAISKTLRKCGVSCIYFLTLASGSGR